VKRNKTVITFKTLDSTSAYLKRHGSHYPDLTVVRALDQRSGHGQHGRVWISEASENLLFSILLKKVGLETLGGLMETLRDVMIAFFRAHGIMAMFKPPNDIMAGELKITGILIESKSTPDSFHDVVAGIGINVNQTDFKGLRATSMRLLTGTAYDCDLLFEEIIDRLLASLGSHTGI
jgi:BirA family transcriptional regulator, biotin operon repressor / biotin---[acetyl-CoA-carboxylase] ligase